MAKTKPTEGFLVMPTYTAALEEIADSPELVKEITMTKFEASVDIDVRL